MGEWIKKNKAWLVPLGAGIAGLLTYLGVEMPQWLKDLWTFFMGMG